MGKIFCVMGKSASGKDTIYSRLLENEKLSLKRIVPYTTRPMRDGEEDGKTYHFCDEAKVQKLDEMGKIIELREYNTVYGIWNTKVVKYFGQDKVLPIYIEVEDGERLIRAIDREKQQKEPKYEEMCRRFLADASDFSEENLKKAGVSRRFENRELVNTIQEIEEYVSEN